VNSTYSNYQISSRRRSTWKPQGITCSSPPPEFNTLSSSQSIRVRALVDATGLGETISEAKDTTDYLDYFAVAVSNLGAVPTR